MIKLKEGREPKEKKDFFLLGLTVACLCLLILSWILKGWIENIKKNNLKDQEALNQVLPGFNEDSIENLKKDISGETKRFWNLAVMFDPKDRWFKKDYDLSIYFVEELGRVNQFLKNKAVDKQAAFPELGFKEKLPSEQEAFCLLSQLFGLKELLSLGLDNDINFKVIEPLNIEDVSGFEGMKLAKSRVELTGLAQNLAEFIIQLNEIATRPQVDSIVLKSSDAGFSADLKLSHIVIDEGWKDKQSELPASTDIKEALPETAQNFIRILRSNNPFFVLTAKEAIAASSGEQAQTPADGQKDSQLSRFLYRGKAVMKSKEVVVVEDTLNQETVFLGRGERIGNFILKEFSNDSILLTNTDDGQEMIISRQEE